MCIYFIYYSNQLLESIVQWMLEVPEVKFRGFYLGALKEIKKFLVEVDTHNQETRPRFNLNEVKVLPTPPKFDLNLI